MGIKMKDLAREIDGFLKLFELKETERGQTVNRLFVMPSAHYAVGAFMHVRYIDYDCKYNLTRVQALTYLDWLRRGNIGRHWDMGSEYDT